MGGQAAMTEYERRRLENIKRNDEVLAALKIRSKLSDLSSASAKRQSVSSKSYKRSPEKKRKIETPVVLRRSLRARGVPPDAATANGLDDDLNDGKVNKSLKVNAKEVPKKSPREEGPLAMSDAYRGDDGLESKFRAIILGCSRDGVLNEIGAAAIDSLVKTEAPETYETGKRVGSSVDVEALQLKSEKDSLVKTEVSETSKTEKKVRSSNDVETKQLKSEDDHLVKTEVPKTSKTGKKLVDVELKSENDGLVKTEIPKTSKIGKKVWSSVDLEALELKSENVARLVPGRIMSLSFFPTRSINMIAAGNKFGDIGFWHINGKEEDGDGIHLYHSHSGPVSNIVIDPFSISKMYSSCYDGFIRLMEVEKGIFTMLYHSEYCIFSMSQSLHDRNSLCFGEGRGGFNKWDIRAGKSSLSCDLHEDRINSVDFNSENENMMATSSSDGTACIWDLRLMNADNTTPLTTVSHKRAVHSAYFSPSGKFLATTSLDDKVGLSSGANYEDTSMIYHNNQTGRWLSKFRGAWGWDDSCICIGNMKRGVDIISVAGRRVVATLESDLVTAIPCRFDAHPYNVGMLAGATSGGQVYIWTQP